VRRNAGTDAHPPKLAFEHHPAAAAACECSVIHDEHDKWHLPDDATDRMWTRQYLAYRTRQVRGGLRAAECLIESEDGLACLHCIQLAPRSSHPAGGAASK